MCRPARCTSRYSRSASESAGRARTAGAPASRPGAFPPRLSPGVRSRMANELINPAIMSEKPRAHVAATVTAGWSAPVAASSAPPRDEMTYFRGPDPTRCRKRNRPRPSSDSMVVSSIVGGLPSCYNGALVLSGSNRSYIFGASFRLTLREIISGGSSHPSGCGRAAGTDSGAHRTGRSWPSSFREDGAKWNSTGPHPHAAAAASLG